jgi:hypothetical protein
MEVKVEMVKLMAASAVAAAAVALMVLVVAVAILEVGLLYGLMKAEAAVPIMTAQTRIMNPA